MTIPTLIFTNSDSSNYTPPANIYAMRLRKGIRNVAKRFLGKPEQQPRSPSDPSPSASMAGSQEQDLYATAVTSSGCPPTSEEPAFPLKVHAALPAGDNGSEDCFRPMSTSEIRVRTNAALARRLTPEELRGVKLEGSVDSTAKIIEDLKTTLHDHNQHSKTASNILQHINRYCAIVDIAIQHHPDVTALVWAGARTFIQVGRMLNNVISEIRSHSHPSWRPITMKPS